MSVANDIAWLTRLARDPQAEELGFVAIPNRDLLRLIELLALLSSEKEEEARLAGMGSEREARLVSQVAELTREREKLRAALQWYVDSDDTNEGGKWDEANAFWISGKRNAQRLLGLESE